MSVIGARFFASMLGCAATAAMPADAIGIPPGFGVRPTGILESVVYAEVVAQSPNPIHRAAIEAQCEMARTAGLTARRPVFEPGHDAPLKTETLRFGNAQHRAEFVLRRSYDCALPVRTTRSADMLCGCTYRMQVHRSVHVDRGTASAAEDARTLSLVRQLAPEVIAPDTIAGIPCTWRRQRLSDDAWIDRCVAEDPANALPGFLRGRALAETTFSHHGASIHTSSRATRVVLDAEVDTGVFTAPVGDVAKERKP